MHVSKPPFSLCSSHGYFPFSFSSSLLPLSLCCAVTWLYFSLDLWRKTHKAFFWSSVHILHESRYFLKWLHSVSESLWVSVLHDYPDRDALKYNINTANSASFLFLVLFTFDSELITTCWSHSVLLFSFPAVGLCCKSVHHPKRLHDW